MDASFFHNPGFIFGIAAGFSWLAKRLRLPHVLFLLLAGVVFGIGGLGWWSNPEAFQFFADVGIAMLLFLVGLEISPAFFREVGIRPVRLLLRNGLVLAIAGGIWAHLFHLPWLVTVAISILFTFNSTMLALKALGERQELGKTHARLITSLLILQDVVAGALLLFASIGQAAASEAVWSTIALIYLVKVGGLALFCWIVARFWLRKAWRNLAKQTDVFLLAAFAYPLLVGSIFALFGVSSEIGALMAGLSLAQSDYRYELISRLKPIREIFLAPFFFLIGLQWAWQDALPVWPMILLGWFIVGIFGPLLLMLLVRREGYTRLTSVSVGLHLSHMSEFVLLFLSVAAVGLALPISLRVALVSIVILSMISGALLMEVSPIILRYIRKSWPEQAETKMEEIKPTEVILFGCHRVGSDFLPVLKHQKRSFMVVDMDPQVIQDLQSHRINGLFGDLGNRDLLEVLKVQKAKMIISTVPELGTQLNLLRYLKKHHAKPIIIVVAQEIEDALTLYKQGATYVILPHFLGGNYASQLIDSHGYDPEPFEVERLRHLDHLKRRDRSVIFTPMMGKGK